MSQFGRYPATTVGSVSSNQGSPNTLANAWPVKITDGTDLALVTPSGELMVTGTITTSPDVNIHDSTGAALTALAGSLNVNVTNTVSVTGGGNFTVVQPTGTNLHAVIDSGTITANAGTNLNTSALALESGGHLASIDTKLTSPLSVNATQTGTWTVQPGNTANTTPWLTTISQGGNSATVSAGGALKVDNTGGTQPVSGTVTANAGTGTFTVGQATGTNLHTVVDSGTITANIGTSGSLALDASVTALQVAQASTTSGQKGTLDQGAVTTAAPAYTTGQTSPLSLTTAGALRVDASGTTQPVSGTVTANIGTSGSLALDASVTGLQVTQGSTTSGQKGELVMAAVTTAAPTYTTAQSSPLSQTTGGGLRVAQSGTWTVQPGNTANTTPWRATISQGGNDASVNGSALAVDGSGVTQPISAASLPLPTGASTSALQTTGNTSLSSINGKMSALGQNTMAASMPVVIASNQTAVPVSQSGTWTVQPGNTANTTPWLATISQGGNSATVSAAGALKVDGSAVTQPVSGTVTANAGTGTFTVTSTDDKAPTATITSVATSTTTASLLAANASRKGFSVYNNGATMAFVTAAATGDATTTVLTAIITQGTYNGTSVNYTGALSVILAAGTGNVVVTEFT